MTIPLSDREAAILLGATLMHWGVPFHRAAKRELTDDQRAAIDTTSAKLIALREECQRSAMQNVQEANLSDHEITLLIAVVEDCVAECGDDATELSLQLKTSSCQEVESLITRLSGSISVDARNLH